MKKLHFNLFALALLFTFAVNAQDDAPKRPADIGDSEYDDFKNTSFNVLEQSSKLKENVTFVDNEVKSYSGVMSTVTTDKIKGNYKALTGFKNEAEGLTNNIGQLDDKGKNLVSNAGNVTPKMKSIKATTNTKKSVEGLDAAKGNLGTINEVIQTDTNLLGDELKSRGEPIE